MRNGIVGTALMAVVAIALIGCNSTAGGSAAASTGTEASAAPSEAAPTATPAEATASAAAPSEAAASEAAPSEAIPSFAFPSSDKELEALLPATICGAKVQKLSMGGEMFAGADPDPAFAEMLQKLGKTAADVSLAIAAPLTADTGCAAGIFRIKGADGAALKAAFLEAAVKDGNKFEAKSIGGKDVYVDPTADSFGYAYFKGDAMMFASAKDESAAATILAALP